MRDPAFNETLQLGIFVRDLEATMDHRAGRLGRLRLGGAPLNGARLTAQWPASAPRERAPQMRELRSAGRDRRAARASTARSR
jgi:hypothetical protein